MKIGIITFHRPLNYGAILQTYALVKKINDINYDAEIIDYRNSCHEKVLNNMNFKTASGIKARIKSLIFAKINKNKKYKFQQFTNNNIKISKIIYDQKNVNESNKEYDFFITGSDQVWNLNLTNGDYTYFLNFVKSDINKISYASSFGYSKIPEKYKQETARSLNNYKKISVREQQAANIINDLLNKDVDVVLDPTLLLTKKEWLKISKKVTFRVPEKYILLYAVSPTKEDFEMAKKFSKIVKMKIILINYNMKYIFGMKNCFDMGPEEFIWLIENASYVLTNSFHGTAFSINFNKEFYVRLSKKENNGNSRIENIINLTKLNNRYLDENCIINKEKINWKEVNKIINEERNRSIKFLKENIR